jgi:hypothetical protein
MLHVLPGADIKVGPAAAGSDGGVRGHVSSQSGFSVRNLWRRRGVSVLQPASTVARTGTK